MTIKELLRDKLIQAEDKIKALKDKTIEVPKWEVLEKEYNPKKHAINEKSQYPDVADDKGRLQSVTRVACGFQKLAVKRMTELSVGIPVKRVYKPENNKQKEIAKFLEAIYQANRIDSLNNDRLNMLFASCEVLTLWYSVEHKHASYGFDSTLKLRCRNFSPKDGEELYPLFDEYGDLVALSIAYKRKQAGKVVEHFDTYTDSQHLQFIKNESNEWQEVLSEEITLGKIPAVYVHRPEPIWEDTSNIVSEIEWALSRNGNYLRENSKPLFVLFADEEVNHGGEGSPDEEFKGVLQYPANSKAQYVTWQQAVDNLKFHTTELRSLFFTQLQLPDWSYDKMSQQALSGESRKQMFIDAQLKVKDESGRLLEFFDREMNVIKAYLKKMLGKEYHADVDRLKVEMLITPFMISDEKDTISNLMTANGGKPIISQREAIELYGHSDDVDKTLEEIAGENMHDSFELTN